MTESTPKDEARSQSLFSSFVNAGRGFSTLYRSERNFRIHLLFAVTAIVLGFWLHISVIKWMTLLLTIGFVLTTEAINSAIETTVDLAEPNIHPLAGRAKDMAAAAVLIASIISVMIGLLLFIPPLWTKFIVGESLR